MIPSSHPSPSQQPRRKRDRFFSKILQGLYSNKHNHRHNNDNESSSDTSSSVLPQQQQQQQQQDEPSKMGVIEVTTIQELDDWWGDDSIPLKDPKSVLSKLSVKGDTQIIGSPSHLQFVHPVVQTLHDRRRKQQQQQQPPPSLEKVDFSFTEQQQQEQEQPPPPQKVALVIEGGGMRGCVTAGMVCAINYLGLRDCVDVVYGSSAGSIIGAYFITGQLPWFGPEVYYDQLPVAGTSFIDTSRLFRALGLGLIHPRLVKDVITRPNAGKPVLNLDYLLKDTLQKSKPLDWTTFVERQKVQPLKVVVSALKSEMPLALDYENGYFATLEELAQCMHASCLLPGIAGPVANVLKQSPNKTTGGENRKPKFVMRNNFRDPEYEPLADALVYAPIAYDSALAEGATHMIVLRSKPDGGDVIGKGGSIGEKLVWSRFFRRKNTLPHMYNRLTQQLHKRLYARNVLELNAAAKDCSSSTLPPTLTIALPPGQDEIPRLETSREVIFEGVRQGFARAYDTLVEDPKERGRGYEVASSFFPDEILEYSPDMVNNNNSHQGGSDDDIDKTTLSSFERYMAMSGIWPKAWKGLSEAPIKYTGYDQQPQKDSSSSLPTPDVPVSVLPQTEQTTTP
jgi:predicted acylesterase/phospholipase RssA